MFSTIRCLVYVKLSYALSYTQATTCIVCQGQQDSRYERMTWATVTLHPPCWICINLKYTGLHKLHDSLLRFPSRARSCFTYYVRHLLCLFPIRLHNYNAITVEQIGGGGGGVNFDKF